MRIFQKLNEIKLSSHGPLHYRIQLICFHFIFQIHFNSIITLDLHKLNQNISYKSGLNQSIMVEISGIDFSSKRENFYPFVSLLFQV